MRSLGDAEVVNSTLSGNESVGWHGGAVFQTDGVMNLVNSTVADNVSPADTGALFVGTFTDAGATLTLHNTIVAGNSALGLLRRVLRCRCRHADVERSQRRLGRLVQPDGRRRPTGHGSAARTAGRQRWTDADPCAVVLGSPAIDAADAAVCPATDQRGVARDADCDIGAFEFVP